MQKFVKELERYVSKNFRRAVIQTSNPIIVNETQSSVIFNPRQRQLDTLKDVSKPDIQKALKRCFKDVHFIIKEVKPSVGSVVSILRSSDPNRFAAPPVSALPTEIEISRTRPAYFRFVFRGSKGELSDNDAFNHLSLMLELLGESGAYIKELYLAANASRLLETIRASWGKGTSADLRNWTKENPAWGQSQGSAIVVQHYLGGDILCSEVILPDERKVSYYYNSVDGKKIEVARSQFPDGVHIPEGTKETKEKAVKASPVVRLRIGKLKKKVAKALKGNGGWITLRK